MNTVQVSTLSRSYEVRIGSGILPSLGNAVCTSTEAKKCMVVSGENVFPHYGDTVMRSLREAGLEAENIIFPSGETTKCLRYYGQLLEAMAEKKLTRSDCVIALGGGVTGDLAGFATATYQRGIAFIQVPTTLLAAVDSSVGGKTAINLPQGKNQVGAFHQPSLVLCDTDTLSTLPEREFLAGMAEVIKTAVLFDADLFDDLQHRAIDLAGIIESCVMWKAAIVKEDEFDTGRRRLLNLGHTFGHAVESCSHYEMLHGEAVAVGLSMICRAAVSFRMLDAIACDAVISLLQEYGLPTQCAYSAQQLYDAMLLDKKFSHGKLHLIVPRSIDWCEDIAVTPDEARIWLERGLSGTACGQTSK
ncbi:MAG: 3-dehydroquinate synthase [Oscillospiraceae bacterium]|nr:3-dehydroquinate synthase [Oscillospiraceae bacterium]